MRPRRSCYNASGPSPASAAALGRAHARADALGRRKAEGIQRVVWNEVRRKRVRSSQMKRLALVLGILLCALAGFGGAIVATQALASPAPPTPPTRHLVGYAGKIIAVKPPGDWSRPG